MSGRLLLRWILWIRIYCGGFLVLRMVIRIAQLWMGHCSKVSPLLCTVFLLVLSQKRPAGRKTGERYVVVIRNVLDEGPLCSSCWPESHLSFTQILYVPDGQGHRCFYEITYL